MSFCCDECFHDKTLKEFIVKNGEPDFCDYCNEKRKHCIDPQKLSGLFSPLANLYTGVQDLMGPGGLDGFQGEFIWEIFSNEWDIFTFYDFEKQKELTCEILEDEYLYLDDWVIYEDEFFGVNDEQKRKTSKKWDSFCNEIKHKNRFFPSQTIANLEKVIQYCKLDIKKDTVYYRALISYDGKAHSKDSMGKSPDNLSCAGRANPEGISYLYLASTVETAISEVKPYISEFITVGIFEMDQDLKLIDLRSPLIESPFNHDKELKYIVDNLYLLRLLAKNLSKPLNPNQSRLSYIPTQYLCELIKNQGYEGLTFKSSLADGDNIVLFDDKKCKETSLYKVTNIKNDFEKL